MQDKYKGQTAIVTGASRGIGLAVAKKLAVAGMKIAATARSTNQLDEVAGKIRDDGGVAEAIPADLTNEAKIIYTCAGIQPGRSDTFFFSTSRIFPPFHTWQRHSRLASCPEVNESARNSTRHRAS